MKTLLRAAARKSLVRLRGVGDGCVLASAKDNAIEVLRDAGGDLEFLFEECIFGTVWALQALSPDHLAACGIDFRQAVGSCTKVCFS
jgi:hypothetical protein